MATDIIRRKTPEERELEKKQAELILLESKLAEQELTLATLKAELHSFESLYLKIVGSLYVELDEIRAQIAEVQAKLTPDDPGIRRKAEQARAQADETAKTVGASHEGAKRNGFKPSESLKKLYREVAKRIHPDLATDDDERARRQRFMAEANQAYEDGDEARLKAILEEWESSPESVKGKGTAAELIRVIRKIAQIEQRLYAIESEIAYLKGTDLFELKMKYDEARNDGRDLLAEMASQVEGEITEAKKRLEEILRLG